jgi:hypothetical protein
MKQEKLVELAAALASAGYEIRTINPGNYDGGLSVQLSPLPSQEDEDEDEDEELKKLLLKAEDILRRKTDSSSEETRHLIEASQAVLEETRRLRESYAGTPTA